MFVVLKQNSLINGKIIVHSQLSARLRAFVIRIYFVLANRAAWITKGLFYLLKFMRSTVFLPIKLIKEANDNGWLRTLSYYVRMKALYVNNTHYGYNLRTLSKKLGCSIGCLSVHIRTLRIRGLVVDHAGNLTFKGYKKLQADWGHKCIGVPVDPLNQLNLLRAQIIRFNLQQQAFNIKKSEIQECPRDQVPSNLAEKMKSCYVGLSASGFARLLHVSKAQGAAIRADLISIGLLEAHRRYSRLIASGGPFGGSPADSLREMKKAGIMPVYSFLRGDYIMTERRLELKYGRA